MLKTQRLGPVPLMGFIIFYMLESLCASESQHHVMVDFVCFKDINKHQRKLQESRAGELSKTAIILTVSRSNKLECLK